MPTNDRAGKKDPAHAIAPATEDRPDRTPGDPTRTCPACHTPIRATRRVDPVTYVLDPCGHQVDDRVHAELQPANDRRT